MNVGVNLRTFAATGIAGSAVLLAGCATTPVAPTAALDAAKVSIAKAEGADASNYAGAELSQARERLASAQSAVEQKNMVDAERLAEQARVDADLAAARTEAAKAAAVNAELSKGSDALNEEMQRAGDRP